MDKKHSKRRHRDSSSDEETHTRKHHKDHRDRKHHPQKHSHERDSHEKHSRKQEKDRSRHRDKRQEDYDPNIRIKQERIKQEKDAENYEHQQRERSNHDARRQDRRREREREGGDFGMNTESQPKPEEGAEEEEETEPKQNPSFELSGKLTEDTNTFRGVVIKYNEPPEAMVPKRRWRLYPFKGETALPVLHIHRQSAFLLGRDRKIADIPVDHPSCSKQQAVLQYRAVNFTKDNGSTGRRVRPFIIDLESSNGTYLNDEKIDPKRYYELKEKDVMKFGFSTREYVILHDKVDVSEVAGDEEMDEL